MAEQTWNGEDFTAFTPQGDELPWVDAMARAYPRAVAGALEDFMWDRDAHALQLAFTQQGDAVSELAMPVRHVGESPRIEVTGGRWRWLPDAGLLLVRGEPGDTVTVTVQPE
jgi:hypothetical protein